MDAKVAFVVTAYDRPRALRTCLSSIRQQTEPWRQCIVVNNGPEESRPAISAVCYDNNVGHYWTRSRTKIKGAIHSHSLYKATELGVAYTDAPWLCFPNDDSYYCPWFLERMLRAAEREQWDLVYCDFIAGGPVEHHLMLVKPQLCCIDKTCFLVKRKWFQGFPDVRGKDYEWADGLMIEELVRRGIRHGRVGEVLVVHN